MVLALQLVVTALCGGFIVVVVRDWAATNVCLARWDVQDLNRFIRRAADKASTYPEGYDSMYHQRERAGRYVLGRAEARYRHMKRWGF